MYACVVHRFMLPTVHCAFPNNPFRICAALLHCRYIPLSPLCAKNMGWDQAVQSANRTYSQRMHNICCDNCHSHVACALNAMGYTNLGTCVCDPCVPRHIYPTSCVLSTVRNAAHTNFPPPLSSHRLEVGHGFHRGALLFFRPRHLPHGFYLHILAVCCGHDPVLPAQNAVVMVGDEGYG